MQQIGLRRVGAVKERGRSGDITGHARKRASALAVASEVTLGGDQTRWLKGRRVKGAYASYIGEHPMQNQE